MTCPDHEKPRMDCGPCRAELGRQGAKVLHSADNIADRLANRVEELSDGKLDVLARTISSELQRRKFMSAQPHTHNSYCVLTGCAPNRRFPVG